MSKKERIILILLAGLNFTHILDFMIMMPLGNYLMPAFDISASQFTWLVSAYSISAFVAGIGAALIVDRFDRKKVLLISYSFFLSAPLPAGWLIPILFFLPHVSWLDYSAVLLVRRCWR